MTIRYRYIHRSGDYHYFRFPGSKCVRLQGTSGSDEYFTHYAELMQRVGKPLPKKLPANLAAARYVYLFERADGIIKVGIAKNVRKRRSTLANACVEKLSILRILKPNNCWPVHIESAFKSLMRPCRLRGEWFKCNDVLAIVALHVVEHGDLIGHAVVRAVLADPNGHESYKALRDYALDLKQKFPDDFTHINYWSLAPLPGEIKRAAKAARQARIISNSKVSPLSPLADLPNVTP